ncbi:hypothetical protein [Phycisphaera mikurensis]|uniref:Uncharacterized protein n=1 Tax=Phycisphaera mikurensis (strain NBRC 102666 / KCTC 22515 / FYK2301M01) TaxID=1142394 RepID=I0ID87_PHYMF|nr:hypothetical protein [Phycisphaera mikurensis]MBB6442350.1 hypothetical protein [Phycisphaera mikurensis]BAM03225.1 hypothetical protein PSMK_10660 [Phycisphaera mikurensis NBRC 102666]
MPASLATYRPFIDPLDVDGWWPLLLLPLLFAVALVYKTLKLPTLDRLVPESLKLAGEVLAAMVALALLLRWLT